jgi:hypothetical protein
VPLEPFCNISWSWQNIFISVEMLGEEKLVGGFKSLAKRSGHSRVHFSVPRLLRRRPHGGPPN